MTRKTTALAALTALLTTAQLCYAQDAAPFKSSIALNPDAWKPRDPAVAEAKAGKDGELLVEVKPAPGKDWVVLDGPSIQIPKRDKFALGRAVAINGEARMDDAEGYAAQLRARPNGGKGYTRNRAPHALWETTLEIMRGEKMKSWSAIDGSSTLPYDCGSLSFELWLAVPKGKPSLMAFRGLELRDEFKRSHIIRPEPWSKGNIFFSGSGLLKVEFAGASKIASWSVEALDEYGAQALVKKGEGNPGVVDFPLDGKGYFKVKASARYADGGELESSSSAAVVGESLPDSIRLKSRFGSMRVHGSGEIWKASGCNWDWGIGGIQLKDWVLDADGSVSPPPGWKPLKTPSDLSIVMTVGSFPKWLYGPNAKGDGLYPPKDWALFERLFEAFAKANPELELFCPYNEPNACWRGSPEEFLQFNKSMAAGVKRGNPAMKVYGPCLYSIDMKEFSRLVAGGMYDVQEGVVMHAYVNATPPEGEFIERVQAMIDCLKDAGKGELPVHLTEFGWCSGVGDWQKTIPGVDRARYVARSLSLLAAKRVDNISYFCFHYEGGAGQGDAEPGYSLLNNNGTPTPSYAVFVNTLKWLSEIKKGDARWFRLSPNLNMVLGKAGERVVGSAWTCEGEESFELPEAPLKIEDMAGRPAKAQDGARKVKLSPSPLFFELPASCQLLAAKELKESVTVPGGAFKVELAEAAPLAGLSTSGASGKAANDAAPGSYLLSGKDAQGAWAVQPVKIVPPIEFKSFGYEFAADGKGMNVVARVASKIDSAAKASLKLGPVLAGSLASETRSGQDLNVSMSVPGFESGKRFKGSLLVETTGAVKYGVERDFDQTVLECPVLQEDALHGVAWSSVPGVDISAWGPWPEAQAPENCSAALRTAVGTAGFHLKLDARDDVHYQSCSPAGMWQEDSIQIAFDVDAESPWLYNNIADGRFNGHRIFEYGAAHPSKGGAAMLWRWRADAPDMKANCSDPNVEASVKRDGAAKSTVYELFIPWASLGLKEAPQAGSQIGFSLALNDVDKGRDRRVVRFGNGIIDGKDPERFARLRITSKP